jgi:pantothenate kinase
LLNEAPWHDLLQLFDYTVAIDAPIYEVKRRLLKRWLELGYSISDAMTKIEENDLLNAQLVLQNSQPANFVIHQQL